MITSAQNPRIKLVRALLGRPKERREANAFVAEGVRLVEEALAAGSPFRFVLHVEALNERAHALLQNLQANGMDCELVAEEPFFSLSNTDNSQGILAVLELPTPELHQKATEFVLIPDQIRDPGNLGTLLRTAAAAGVQAVLLPPETTDPFAPKVVRAGMGAHFRLPIRALAWEEIQEIIESARLKVFLADMDGQSCWETNLRKPLALIIGGEADGASQPARQLADEIVSIPMPGKTESLNAAVAGAILMFEVVRQCRL